MIKKRTDEELALMPEKERNKILAKREEGKRYRERHAEKIKRNRDANKEANYQRVKKWRNDNPDKEKIQKKKHYEKNKEKITEYHKKWFQDNFEERKIKAQEYNERTNYFKNRYKNNLEKFKKYSKEYRQKNKEIIYIRNKRRRDLQKNPNCKSTLTLSQARLVYHKFNNQCYKCGSKERLCLDHYHPLVKGNPLSINNAIILCVSCNCSKGGRPPHRFFTMDEMELLYSKYGISRTPINSNNNYPFLFGNLEYSDLVIG